MSGRGDFRRTVAMLRRYAAGQRRALLFASGLLAVEAATAVYQPALLGALINFLKDRRTWSIAGFTPGPGSTIQVLAVAIIVVTAAGSLADSLSEISLAKAGRTVGYNLRVALFGHLQKLSLAFHVRRRTGDVLTRITGDVQALEEFIAESVSDLLGSFLLLAGTVAWLLYKSVQVAVLALVIVPVLAVVSNFFAKRIKAASKQLRAREGELASSAQEMLTSISVVQIYGRGDYEQRKFAGQSRSTMEAVLRTARLEAGFSFTVGVLEAGVIAAVVWVGSLIIHPAISAGLLVTFILQIQNMFKPTRRIIKEWNTVGKIYASVERISELLNREPAVQDYLDAVGAPELRGEIEFRDVSFAYQPGPDELTGSAPARLALDGLSFRVDPGDVVALVGHSGAGKSTIAQLIPRLYDPHAGAVLIDGHDIREFTVESLRAQISMVLQETVLLTGTVAENIAYGREGATFEEVVIAAKQANAHDFITAMPNGYDTPLGERAATLSGGQRQRLAIARGFIRDSPILILDEPTTGLDAESARAVLDGLKTLVRGRSALIVSHDFKLIRSVDRILVMSAGRVLEEGTPADLLARGGLYAELYAREFGQPPAAAVAVLSPASPAELPLRLEEELLDPGPTRDRRFERVLISAVPQPASPETFRMLTGRAARPGLRPLEDADLDPTLSAALNRALPGLAEALDAQAMAPRVQAMLAEGWRLDSCTPGGAIVKPGEGVSLRYRLGLRQLSSGRVLERYLAGRIFPAADLAAGWLEQRVLPLAERVRGRSDVEGFAQLSTAVLPLALALYAFPIDPDRPGLLAATDAARLAKIFGGVLAASVDGMTLQGCLPRVVRYDRDRCVLRYEALWLLDATGHTVKQVMYGKAYTGDQGAAVQPAVTAVRAHLRSSSQEFRRFLVPRFRGYLPELRLALLDALPGTPRIAGLIRDVVVGGEANAAARLVLENALGSCAAITATLHEVDVFPGPARTLADEVEAARSDIAAIASLAPALATSLGVRIEEAAAAVADYPQRIAFGHGNLKPGQFLFDGPLVGLVDFDTVGAADPALDLGRFQGQLAVASRKAQSSAGSGSDLGFQLERSFFERYLRACGGCDTESLHRRVAAQRTLTLARIAAQSWRQLKPARVEMAQRLLDESVTLQRI